MYDFYRLRLQLKPFLDGVNKNNACCCNCVHTFKARERVDQIADLEDCCHTMLHMLYREFLVSDFLIIIFVTRLSLFYLSHLLTAYSLIKDAY